MMPLDLLGVAAGGREDEHRGAVVPPGREADVLLEARRVPPLVRHWSPPSPRSSLVRWITRTRTSAVRGRSTTIRLATGPSSSPSCAHRAPRRSGRPSRPPGRSSPSIGSGRPAARTRRSSGRCGPPPDRPRTVAIGELDHRIEHRPAAVLLPDIGVHERAGLQEQRAVRVRRPDRRRQGSDRAEAGPEQAAPGRLRREGQLGLEARYEFGGEEPRVRRVVGVLDQPIAGEREGTLPAPPRRVGGSGCRAPSSRSRTRGSRRRRAPPAAGNARRPGSAPAGRARPCNHDVAPGSAP